MSVINDSDIKIFDRDALMARLCDNEALVSEVVDVYLEDTPHQIETLRNAHRQGDMEAVVRQSHTIKGASSNVSALRMQSIAVELEKAGKEGELDKVPDLLLMLEEQFHELQVFLAR